MNTKTLLCLFVAAALGGSGARWWNAGELDWSVGSGDDADLELSDATTSYQIDGGSGRR